MWLPCHSCCGPSGACWETWAAAETPAHTVFSSAGRSLWDPCWLSEMPTRHTETFKILSRLEKDGVCADKYLLFLDFTPDMWYLDLQGIQLFIWYLWNSQWLQLLRTLEGELCQWDTPLTVILLILPVRGEGRRWTNVSMTILKVQY